MAGQAKKRRVSEAAGEKDTDTTPSSTGESQEDGEKAKETRGRYKYRLGLSVTDAAIRAKTPVVKCCVAAWQHIYDVSDTMLRTIQSAVKHETIVMPGHSKFTDKTAYSVKSAKQMQKEWTTAAPELNVTHAEARQISSANNVKAKIAEAWMDMFFDLVGDKIPNSKDEIHLEPQEKKEIWEEYQSDCFELLLDEDPMGYDAFLKLWDEAFPHVSIRIFKVREFTCPSPSPSTPPPRLFLNRSPDLSIGGWRQVHHLRCLKRFTPPLSVELCARDGLQSSRASSNDLHVRAAGLLLEDLEGCALPRQILVRNFRRHGTGPH